VCDQLVDALVGVLSSLVRGDQLRVERADALTALGERAAQSGILLAQRRVGARKLANRALEPIEVAGFRARLGNLETPVWLRC
jgi:hypothetical protein